MQIEEKNNQLEVMLCYYPGNPEEGETDSLTIGVTKLRWSIAAMRECEQKNGVYSCLFVNIIIILRVFLYRFLVGKPEGKRPLGRPRRRWVDNIRMDHQEVGCGYMDWIGLAQDRDRWQTLVSAVMNLGVP